MKIAFVKCKWHDCSDPPTEVVEWSYEAEPQFKLPAVRDLETYCKVHADYIVEKHENARHVQSKDEEGARQPG